MIRILAVDDEKPIRELLRLSMGRAGYTCDLAADGLEALHKIEQETYDLILLDVMLPEIDGFTLMEYIAQTQTPVIFLTAKNAVADRVKGLHLGAEDYIIKPFDSKEMVARVKAVLRRYQKPAKPQEGEFEIKCVEYPGLTINLTNYTVMSEDQIVDMPPKELELLYFLASSPNQVFTREQLLDHIWGYEYLGDTRTVDVHVKRLREKLGSDHQSWALTTVWGIGYKFE